MWGLFTLFPTKRQSLIDSLFKYWLATIIFFQSRCFDKIFLMMEKKIFCFDDILNNGHGFTVYKKSKLRSLASYMMWLG